MVWQRTPVFGPLLVSALVCAALALFAWRHRRVPAATGFVLMMASSSAWALFYALYRASADFRTKLLLAEATQAGAIVVPLASAVFALQYTRRERWLTPRVLLLLSAVPALTLAMVVTNPWHHAFWTRFALVERGGRAAIDSVNGWGFWLHVAYSWALLTLGVAIVALRAIRSAQLYRRQAAAIILAGAIPWLGNVLHLSRTVRFAANPMPFLFTLSGAIFFWAIFRLRLLDLVPVAREALVEEMPDGVIVLDETGRVLDLNPAARELLSIRGEVMGRPAAEVLAPIAAALGPEAEHGGRPVRVRLSIGPAVRQVDVRVRSLLRAAGDSGRLIVLRDITEAQRAEGTLAVQRAYLDQLFEAAPEGLALLDAEERVLDVNGEWVRLFGWPVHEAAGRTINELIVPPALRDEGIALTARVSAGEKAEMETVRQARDGRPVDVYVAGTPVFADGRRVGTWGIYRDISRRKAAERQRAELLERERRARQEAEAAVRRAAFLAEVGTLLSATFDYATGLRQLARLAVPELADYCLIDEVEPEGGTRRVAVAHADPEAEARLLADVRNPPDADEERRPVLRVLRTGEAMLVSEVTPEVLDRLAHDEAHRESLRNNPAPLRSFIIVPLTARGRTLGTITLVSTDPERLFGPADLAVAQEMARRAALAIDNARLYNEAREALRARDSILGVVSHDLRNPLTAILLNVDAALAAGPLPSLAGEALEGVVRSAQAMDRMIQDLLDVARIEARQLRIEPARCAPRDLVGEAVGLMALMAEERTIRLVKAVEGCPDVRADRDRVLQVFSNLVGNALKFTPAGGTVTVGAAPEEGRVRFWVGDTGPGIAAEEVERLWDPFWQGESPARRSGAGLGLPIARGIVEAHGGRAWVESTLGVGTTFHFTVPAM
ncbi:MAG TPA: histidine kinase N-terminal 7TM domain-containing protein [Longimicrobium sp.]|nr:histidine kinase N-terminal 7TM domain-containing protein [Longimicrobium sp.]